MNTVKFCEKCSSKMTFIKYHLYESGRNCFKCPMCGFEIYIMKVEN